MQNHRRAVLMGVGGVLIGLMLGLVTRLEWRGRPPGPAPLPTATVVQQIQGLAQLVSVKYVLEKVVVYEDPKYLGGIIPLGQNRLILLAHGEVKAGVDLSRLAPADVRVQGEEITLSLPPAIVTDAYLVEGRTQVLDWKTGLLAPFDKSLEQTARRYALTEITYAARQSGIETEGTERARTQLTALLNSLGFKRVQIRFRTGS